MPKRKRVQRFFSDEVQGEGSWAVVALMTMKDQMSIRKVIEGKKASPFEIGLKILRAHVRDWNWVDDDDNPFPKPKDDPEVFTRLTDPEVEFLRACIQGDQEKLKNSPSKSP